ncbi:MAG: hypothetical protein HZB95_12210 [Nitrosomonadales bacterium]|nr:hypothetical protein [Nitrosomonadales bacterium]
MALIDFSKISFSSASATDFSPSAVFTRVRKPESKYLRPTDEQGVILSSWYERRNEQDLTIKLNTGAGKTLIGLLALQSSLEESISPAVYLLPDKVLQSQVMSEAAEIGITVTDDPNDLKFLSGKSILVAVAHKLFNGRSVFGVGVGNKRIDIGSIVIDDAHACLQIAKQQFSMAIPSTDESYHQLQTLFLGDLENISKPSALAIADGDPFKWLEVPFYKWKEKTSEVISILARSKSSDVEWKYPLISEYLDLCQCVFSGSCVEIGLRHLPVEILPAFRNAKRRIYMTATLADDGQLVSLIGADAASVAKPILPEGVGSIGERLIIAPMEINPNIKESDIVNWAVEYASRFNVVVLCPSRARAELVWSNVARICVGDSVQPVVEELRNKHVGLVVLVNRYDGIDLPDTACRVLIIDEPPQVVGLIDRIEMAQIEGTHQAEVREIQKVEQGMGRAIRRVDDWCLVMLVGGRLSRLTGIPKLQSYFSQATQAQLELSHQVTKQILDEPLDKIKEAVEIILTRDKGWISASRACIASQRPKQNQAIEPSVGNLRTAFDLACVKKFHEAVREVDAAIEHAKEDRMKGLLMQRKAEYTWHFDKLSAQKLLSSGLKFNRAITPPESGIDYGRVNAARTEQAVAIREKICNWPEPREFLLELRSTLDDLAWDEERTKRFESAIDWLGQHLGFSTQRPDHFYRNGPDNLWAMGDGKFLVIECKSGATGENIKRSDIEQLLHSEAWFKEMYGEQTKYSPIIIHPSHKLATDAVASSESRVIDNERLEKLRTAVNDFFITVCGKGSVLEAAKISENLNKYSFTPGQFTGCYTTNL